MFDEASGGPSVDFTPYDPSTLGTRQSDDALQTAATPVAVIQSRLLAKLA
jgi:hypothetical protein